MMDTETNYRSFLLRLWREAEFDSQPMRIILIDPHTDQRWGFTNIEELTFFLKEETTVLCADKQE